MMGVLGMVVALVLYMAVVPMPDGCSSEQAFKTVAWSGDICR